MMLDVLVVSTDTPLTIAGLYCAMLYAASLVSELRLTGACAEMSWNNTVEAIAAVS
jgi:hypothetical protein